MIFWKRTCLLIVLSVLFGILYWQSLKLSASIKNRTSSPQSFSEDLDSRLKHSGMTDLRNDDHSVITDEPLFPSVEADSITRVRVEDFANKGQFVFERRADTWQMVKPIHFTLDIDVIRFLNSLQTIRAQKKFTSKAEDFSQYGLDHPRIELCVSFNTKEREVCYDFGNNVPNQSGCYGKNGNEVVVVPKLIRDLWLGQTEYALARKQVFPILYYDSSKITIRENAWFVEVVRGSEGWELIRPVVKKLTQEDTKRFFSLINNLHIRSFLIGHQNKAITWNPNRRIVAEFLQGAKSESFILGDLIPDQSGYAAKLSSFSVPFVVSQKKYDELIEFLRVLSFGSVV